MPEPLPYLTEDLPGTGGRIRERIEDFVVEELPLYEASGTGEHLYLTVQKTGVSTHEASRRIAGAAGVPLGHVGFAGLKDSRAVAIQRFSVHGGRESDLRGREIPGVEILAARPHRNKLRLGHLRGNRFLVRIREVGEEAEAAARAVLDRLVADGAPNSFGPQRFGAAGDAHLVGRALVRGDAEEAIRALLAGEPAAGAADRVAEARRRFRAGDLAGALSAYPESFRAERGVLAELLRGRPPARALRRIPRKVHRLLVSSYQSHLFNRLLGMRQPGLGRLERGDLAYLHDRGAVFTVEDVTAEQARADELEISPSGPLFGRKVSLADGEPGRREREMLASEGLELEDFRRPDGRFDGARRPYRVPVSDARVRPDGEGAVLLSFALPKGSFATALLREVMKAEADLPETD